MVKFSLCTQAVRLMRGPFTEMGFLWGQVEIKRSILDKSTWRCLFDIQEEMWSRPESRWTERESARTTERLQKK